MARLLNTLAIVTGPAGILVVSRLWVAMKRTHLLFLIILIEGYVVLAVELLAIRQLLPFAGSGVEVVAIVISGVLLPLALGYHFGGIAYRRSFARARYSGKRVPSIRRILLRNLLAALFILTFGLSYQSLLGFFGLLSEWGLRHRLWQTSAYTFCFLTLPVFLLGQTVPLVSHYFTRARLNEITGKMLFFSTTGAFLGSVFSTLVLMMTIGVHNTVIFTLALLTLLCLFLRQRGRVLSAAAALFIFGVAVLLNNDSYFRFTGIVSDNAYNIARVVVKPDQDLAYLMLNRSISSIISRDPERRPEYAKYLETRFINTLPRTGTPRDILVIGAGGFALGRDDKFNTYTFVDIDPDLKDVAEKYFLPEKISPNKRFVASSARAYLRRDQAKYDLIIVDVFQNAYAVPMESTSREFLEDVKARLKGGGILAVNIIESPDFRDKFSVRYDRTFSDVFPVHDRHIIGAFDPWDDAGSTLSENRIVNVIYAYFNTPLVSDRTLYTDDKNTYSLDRP